MFAQVLSYGGLQVTIANVTPWTDRIGDDGYVELGHIFVSVECDVLL